MKEFFVSIREYLVDIGIFSGENNLFDRLLALLFIFIVVMFFDFACRKIAILLLHIHAKITRQTDEESSHTKRMISSFAAIIPALVVEVLLPIVFGWGSTWGIVLSRLTGIYLCVMVLLFLYSMVDFVYQVYRKKSNGNLPINLVFQIVKYVFTIIAIIIICSIILGKSPRVLLTGIGASAAILSLVFKDTIVGLVSGIQLMSNKMLSIGDWITVPKYQADGVVRQITLNTVKIQNFDNTTITLPPSVLLNESFQNWDSMKREGCRRIKRSINIDMHSVTFCTREMLERYRQIELVREPVERILKESKDDKSHPVNSKAMTNLSIFRMYLEAYIAQQPTYVENQSHMIRQLQPTENGLPLEIYFFTTECRWEYYEQIQADIMDHVLAAVNYFDLSILQRIKKESAYEVK